MLKMKKVGPSMRAKDAPLRQDLRLQFAPALELLEVGQEGIQVALPDGVEPTRLRSLLNAVSNRAGYTVSTELVYKTDKKGNLVLEDGKKIPVAVNVYKTGTKEAVAGGSGDEEDGEDEAPAPPKASKVTVPDPVADPDFDPFGDPDEGDD